jgi:shikimate dehydrogenase
MTSARNGTSFLVGLIGSGIGTSLSPALHEQEADALGIRYLYRVLDIDSLGMPAHAVGDLVTATRLAGYDGLNVTHPVKQLVLDHLDELSPGAEAVGAVNTVVFSGGRSIGHNTDLTGFSRAMSTGLPGASLDRVVLLGAGGAGSAIGHALLSLGVGTLVILDLEPSRAETLAAALATRFGADRATARRLDDTGAPAESILDADGLVHASPTGMEGHPGLALSPELLRPGLWVADIVYRPLETELLHAARAAGCAVLDGGRMASFQAADTFRIITGLEPDPDRMLRHFDELARNTTVGRQNLAHG